MSTEYRRAKRRAQGLATWHVVRYADDFAVLVHGSRADVEALHEDVARVLRPLGLRLAEAKTRIVHLADGFDFLGFHIQWRRKKGTIDRWHLYTFIADRAIRVVEGEDPCPDTQDVTSQPQGRADQTQPDHARLGQLLQVRGGETHLQIAGALRLVASDPMVKGAARLEVDGRSQVARHALRAVATSQRGRDRALRSANGDGQPLPLPKCEDPQPLDRHQPRLRAETVESPLR
jgi:hypothetical protein